MATLKKPLVALLVAPDDGMRRDIVAGVKQITIREGYREGYEVGRPVMLGCETEPWCVLANITAVRHCALAEVTPEELEADGFQDHDDMLEGMRRFYPEMTWDSAVTVIRWENVRGKLVEEYRHRQAYWIKFPQIARRIFDRK
ncbi:MAG: ASCH domain-containing protein [Patescibacteria group bacterium]